MTTNTRIVGSGFTTLNFNGRPIAWLEQFTDSGQDPWQAPQTIYVIGKRFADEIVTSRIIAPGRITVRLREAWNEPVWKNILAQAGVDATTLARITNVAEAQDAMENISSITAQMVISKPGARVTRGKIFHRLQLERMDDGETVDAGSLHVPRTLTFTYIKASYFTGQPTR